VINIFGEANVHGRLPQTARSSRMQFKYGKKKVSECEKWKIGDLTSDASQLFKIEFLADGYNVSQKNHPNSGGDRAVYCKDSHDRF